ncbi:Hypothetical predicted protein [Olea europaea subsp. europaea]|uniref:Uncharacterized protein n=1 Tax=Olea europaea subsp. europaea TaxID=158383 RepID=A0A8S0PJY2_OLEEU|nr:Hypothetical predicted protein [Olea europaea subsp. europaea]
MAIVPCEPPTKIHEPSDESNLPTVARPATHSNELGDNKSEMSKGNGSKGDSIEEEIGQYQESGASERLTGQILEGRISPDLVENVKANDADDSSEFTPPPREMATRAEKGKQKVLRPPTLDSMSRPLTPGIGAYRVLGTPSLGPELFMF